MGSKTTPVPLVLQLIKSIFGIGPIAAEMAQRTDVVFLVGDRHCDLVPKDTYNGR